MKQTKVTVLVGPTAVGKGTVMAALKEKYPQVRISISATTRQPRPGEIDGEHYLFVSEKDFDQLVSSNQMLEWATVHGKHRYGTPRGPVEKYLAAGHTTLIEVDLDGARQIRNNIASAHFVFLAPPSWEELVRRLEGRDTEDSAERQRRLETARTELAAMDEFDDIVVNNEVDTTVAALAELMGLT